MLPLKLENSKVDLDLLLSEANLLMAESTLLIISQDTGVVNGRHHLGDWFPDYGVNLASLRQELWRYWNRYSKFELEVRGDGVTVANYSIDEGFKRLREQWIPLIGD